MRRLSAWWGERVRVPFRGTRAEQARGEREAMRELRMRFSVRDLAGQAEDRVDLGLAELAEVCNLLDDELARVRALDVEAWTDCGTLRVRREADAEGLSVGEVRG